MSFKIHNNFIDGEKFSIFNLSDFQNGSHNSEFNIIKCEGDILKSKLIIQPTKLKHMKSPINQSPAFLNPEDETSDICYHLYIECKYIELNGYLLNLSPMILDVRDKNLYKFPDDNDYCSDRQLSFVYPSSNFYIYFGLTEDKELDIKISNEEPYRYNGSPSEDYMEGNDPLYLFKNNIWYRCVSSMMYGSSSTIPTNGAININRGHIIGDYVYIGNHTIFTTTNTSYVNYDLSNTIPKNAYRIQCHTYGPSYCLPLNHYDGSTNCLYKSNSERSNASRYGGYDRFLTTGRRVRYRAVSGTGYFRLEGYFIS